MEFFDVGTEKEDKISVICFPYAGGGASAYSRWKNKFPQSFGVYPVELPGREQHICEPFYYDICCLAKDITKEIIKKFKGPIILFGHSMGGKIAYEVANNLQSEHPEVQFMIIVSACRAPDMPEKNPIHELENEKFISEIKRFGGTSKEVVENKNIMEFFLPILKADFEMDEKYLDKQKCKINGTIQVFTGIDDLEVTLEEIEW